MRLNPITKINLGSLIFFIYLLLSLYYFQERCLFADSAGYLFNILNDEWFRTPHHRYGAALPQLIPLLISKLHTTPWLEFIIYSVSYPLFYFIIFILILKKIKQKPAAYSILILLLLGVKYSFFLPIYEMQLAIVYASLSYAFIRSYYIKETNYKNMIGFVISIFLCFLTHLQIFPLLLFLVIYNYLDIGLKKIKVLFPIIIVGLAFLIKYLTMDSNGYESNHIASLNEVLERLNHLNTNYTWNNVLKLDQFEILHFFAFMTFIALLAQKLFLKSAFFIFSYLLYIIFICCMVPGESTVVLEKNFMPLTVIIAIPLFQDGITIQSIKTYTHSFILLFAFLAFFSQLRDSAKEHTRRLMYEKTILASLPDTSDKFFTTSGNINKNIMGCDWAISIETLLLSYLNRESKTFYISYEENEKVPKRNDIFIYSFFWKNYSVNNFNKKRFNLNPKSKYETIPPSLLLDISATF